MRRSVPAHGGGGQNLASTGAGGFVYTVKVCELIIHIKRFTGTKTLVKDFSLIADLLGEADGVFFVSASAQLYLHTRPAKGHRDPDRARKKKRGGVPPQKLVERKSVCRLPQTRDHFLFLQRPRLPDELIQTTDGVYIRFQGITRWYRHDYTEAEFQVWADRIKMCDPKRVWAYFNNDRDGYSLKNAAQFLKMLGSA